MVDPGTAMAIAGAASSLAGALGGRSKYYRVQRKRLNKMFRRLYQLQAVSQGRSGAELRKALDEFKRGIDTARAETSGIFAQSRREAVERGRQAGALATQGLVSSGLYSTTLAQAAQRGVGAETSRTIGRIGAEEARQQQGLLMAGTQGQAQLRTLLANLYQQQGGERTSLGLQHIGALFGTESAQRGESPLGAGLAQFGEFLPFLFGGGEDGLAAAMERSPYTKRR